MTSLSSTRSPTTTTLPLVHELNNFNITYCLVEPLINIRKVFDFRFVDPYSNKHRSVDISKTSFSSKTPSIYDSVNSQSLSPGPGSNSLNQPDPNSNPIPKYEDNLLHFFSCILIWDTVICILVHLIVAIFSFWQLYKHHYGRTYSCLIFFSFIFHPIGVGILSSLLLSLVISELALFPDLPGPGVSLFLGIVLNLFMLFGAFVIQKYLRFI